MAGYIGGRVAISSPQQIETKHTLTATASQTSIPNIGYTVGAVHVYQNGVRLVDGTDYTATNGSTVTLETGATEGDQIVIVSHGSFETGDVVSKASGGTFSAGITANGDITASGGTVLVTGDTAAGDDAAIGYTSAEGLILTGQGTTNDVTIKNDADADVIEIPTGTVNVTMAGTLGVTGVITGGGLVVPDGSLNLADLDIDGGTDIGAALVDADLMIVDDGAGGTNRKATMSRLATYMGTKIGGGMEFIASSGAISDGTASVSFTQFDATKYDHYAFYFQHVVPATNNVILYGYHSTDGGSNYDTTSGDYHNAGNTDASGFPVSYYASGAKGSGYGVSGLAHLYAPHLAEFTMMSSAGVVTQLNGGGIQGQLTAGATARLAAEDTDAIKFAFSSGNIESGEITMFGIVNS